MKEEPTSRILIIPGSFIICSYNTPTQIYDLQNSVKFSLQSIIHKPMRTIRFRIKTDVKSKEWHYFDWNYSESWSAELSNIEDKTTLGQYCECEDIKGKDAFEGDICKLNNGTYRILLFHRHRWVLASCYEFQSGFFYGSELTLWYYTAGLSGLQIVGNIHDNPELIEKCK